ncbi:phage tail tape measure protein [Deferribacter autotrophicus]|uniref:Phage tail tape measure protein n=1 Tax=Deferribacter autotrophicus TaxID=500465 RepID=A0A5A8F2U5_9BACT|nr:phage tail tape measure protein [Deferribacter autotrophicus]KAA0257215.1 phage tail tape measure protein [Deferribacter autotrophicus]
MKQYVLGIKIGAAFDSTFKPTLNRAKESLRSLNKLTDLKLRLDSKIKDARKKFSESVSSWRSVAGTALTVSMPVKIGADFEFQMTRVGALLNVTGDKFEALEKKAMQLGSTTMYSSSQVGQAMEYLAMAGFSTNQILQTVGPTLNLATVGNIELGRAADISSDILSGFGLKAKDLTRVVDVMSKTISTSNSSVESLGEAMKYVAPVAKSLGVSIEETSAMLGLLHNVGIKGSMAGTTLRAMMSRLSAPTGAAAKALQRLGVQTTDAYGKMRPMQEILKDIGERLELLPEAKRMEFVKAIFGEEPAAGAIELIVQAKTGGLGKYIDEVENASGSASKMVGRMNDTVVARFKAVASALEGMFLTIYKPIEPLVKFGLDVLVGGIRALTSVLKVVSPVLSPIVFTLGMFYVASKLAAIGMALMRLQALLGAKSLLTFGIRIPFLSSGMMMLGKSSLFAGISFGKLFGILRAGAATLLANPIFLVGAAVATGAYLAIKNWSKVKEFFKSIGQTMKNVFVSLGGAIKKVFKIFLMATPIGAAYFAIKNWKKVKEFFKGFGVSVKNIFASIGNAIKNVFKSVVNVVLTPFKLIGKAFNLVKKPFGWIKGLFGGEEQEAAADRVSKSLSTREKDGTLKIIEKNNAIKQTEKVLQKEKDKTFIGKIIEKFFHTEKKTEKESVKTVLEHKAIKETDRVLRKDSFVATKSEKKDTTKELKEFKENKIRDTGITINSINININSDRPVEVIKKEAPQIKTEVKRIIFEVFDDLKRKQALAYNK